MKLSGTGFEHHSDECEISVQEQRFSGGVQGPAKPAAKGFAADKPASGSRPFECCTIDHSDNSPYLIFKHHLTRPSDKCKISMQDKREKFRYTPRIQPRVKPNSADKSARKPQTFESRLFDHLGTSPYSPAHKRAILYYNRFGGPRQRETRSKRGGRAKGERRLARPRPRPPAVRAGQGSGRVFLCVFRGAPCLFSSLRTGVSGPFAVQPFAAGGSLPSARSWRVMPSK